MNVTSYPLNSSSIFYIIVFVYLIFPVIRSSIIEQSRSLLAKILTVFNKLLLLSNKFERCYQLNTYRILTI